MSGYLAALAAGTLWGTTGPLSTALYAAGAELTGIGFWRIAVASVGFLAVALLKRDMFGPSWRLAVISLLAGGALVASFEVAYQFAIAGVGVAGASALLYTAPAMVAVLAHVTLGERLTAVRALLAVTVGVGAALTVRGGTPAGDIAGGGPSAAVGVSGGLIAASCRSEGSKSRSDAGCATV